MTDAVAELREGLEGLTELCGGAVIATSIGARAVRVELRDQPSEPVEIELGPGVIRLSFAGWVEELGFSEGDDDAREEAVELGLDLVAAAVFGELRITEVRRAGRPAVLRRSLEVCVAGSWRVYARRGSLGLAGAIATVLGRLERQLRSNPGRVRRPKPLRDAGPSGLPSAPWAGAGRLDRGQGVEVAIDGELDLHNFSPKEVAPLVREYIEVCHGRGIRDLRIVHGKGKGVLRRTVHSLLAKHEAVESYRLGGHREGSWGATIVRLRE